MDREETVLATLWPLPFPPPPQRASARDRVGMVGAGTGGLDPLRAKQRKRVLNVRHVVHGVLSQR